MLQRTEPKHGANQNISTGTHTKVPTRQDAAQTAGLSKWQKDTALRVAKVPIDDFEREVESDWHTRKFVNPHSANHGDRGHLDDLYRPLALLGPGVLRLSPIT